MATAKAFPTPVSHLKSHTGFWLRFVSNHVSHAFARKLLARGVTVAEWVILREMFDTPSTAPSALAELIGLTRGAVSKLVDRLVIKKLVKRTERDDDHRFQTIALTAAARRLVPALAELADRNDDEFFSVLSPRERRNMVEMLKKVVRAKSLTTMPVE